MELFSFETFVLAAIAALVALGASKSRRRTGL